MGSSVRVALRARLKAGKLNVHYCPPGKGGGFTQRFSSDARRDPCSPRSTRPMNTQLLRMHLDQLLSAAIAAVLVTLGVAALASAPAVAAQAQFDVMINVSTAQTPPQTGVCDSRNTIDGQTLICKARPVAEIPATTAPVNQIATPPTQATEPSAVAAGPVPPSGENSLAPSPVATSQTAEGRSVLSGAYRVTSAVTGVVGWVDIYTSAGMSTEFRLVSWADREYIEMTVRW